MPERTSRRRGFTLLEVLVALAILSGTLVMAYRVMTSAIEAEERSERWTAASFLGEAMLRETTETFPEVSESEGNFPGMDNVYAWKKVVRQAMHPDAREVEITVTWGKGDREETVTLSGIAIK